MELMELVDKTKVLKVRTNADTPKDAAQAIKFGAEGIGLFRTEHMFYGEESDKPLFLLRKMIMSKTLAELFPFVKRDVKATMEVMDGLPVTFRLLDPPLHEFVPHGEAKQAELAKSLGIALDDVRKRGEALHESNPMMGHRGVRLGITYPDVSEMQIRAILAEGGYSEYTRSLYRQQHAGAETPADFRDAALLRWRADILNTVAARVHREVKAIKPHLLVTWSPSVYPWSYEEYLQDWPAWVRAGHADLVHPQVYRYSHEEYLPTLATQTPAALGLSGQKNIIYPGVLISLGPYLIPDDELTGAVATNRAMGFNGEVFFFFEGLRRENARLARALLATHYARPARLPFPTRN